MRVENELLKNNHFTVKFSIGYEFSNRFQNGERVFNFMIALHPLFTKVL